MFILTVVLTVYAFVLTIENHVCTLSLFKQKSILIKA